MARVEWRWKLRKDLPFMDAGEFIGWCKSHPESVGFYVKRSEFGDDTGVWPGNSVPFTDVHEMILDSIIERSEWIHIFELIRYDDV